MEPLLDPASGKAIKKGPACDQCKTSRVRCLGRENPSSNSQCARCVDKGIPCMITPVQRGRPRKMQVSSTSASSTSGTPQPPSVAASSASTSYLDPAGLALSPVENQLGAIAVQNNLKIQLMDTFCELPLASVADHVLSKLTNLIHINAPNSDYSSSEITLMQAMLAVAALASPAVVSVSTAVAMHKMPAVKLEGMDLRTFGKARVGLFESLKQQAYFAAKEGEIALECSEDNASACQLLGFLDSREKGRAARPYASAYMQHQRTLAEKHPPPNPLVDSVHRISAQLSIEALNAVVIGKPIPVTTQDMITLCGTTDSNLDPLLDGLRVDWTGRTAKLFDAVIPYCLSVTKLAQDAYQLFTCPQSHRRPLDESSVYSYLNSLTKLSSAVDLITTQGALALLNTTSSHINHQHINRLLFFWTSAWATLYLPIYREITRRSSAPSPIESPVFDKLARLVCQATVQAACRVSEAVRDVYAINLLTHIQHDRTEEFTQILICEGETAKEMGIDTLNNLKWLVHGMKLAGWSNTHQEGTISVAELHIAVEERKRANKAMSAMRSGQSLMLLENQENVYWDWSTTPL